MAAILSPNSLLFASLLWVLAEWVRRVLWIVSFKHHHKDILKSSVLEGPSPMVSVIIPCRNEERNIPNCLRHLFSQTYAHFEIIVVNDRSTDRTAALLENFKKLSPVSLTLVTVDHLPEGWTGKNNAMAKGAKAAVGDYLLFTDADTTHSPESIRSAVTEAIENQIDFLTLAPETECRSFWEHTVQPLAVSSLALWFDPRKINSDQECSALANGQFILIKKDVYTQLGGATAVRQEVLEDVAFAKLARKNGFKVRFLNGTRLYSTRMYSSLGEIKTGWTRILTYLLEKNIFSILHKMFLFLFFSIFPFVTLGWQIMAMGFGWSTLSASVLTLSAFVSGWIVLIRFVGNRMVRSNPWYAFLHPLGSLVMVWILGICLWRVVGNRPSVWKGQYYR